jgi:oxygen-independent coproporphyrinogen-3 oxidase
VLNIPKSLITKYAVSVPRYTSYPTAVEFRSDFKAQDWKAILEKSQSESKSNPLSIYVHIPFCPKLCYFCACNKIITTDTSVTRNYLSAVFKELATLATSFEKNPVHQIHWGGGSPNFLNPEQMIALHTETLKRFPNIQSTSEVSVELDPRTTSIEQLQALKQVGFNRVSFGVQDFDHFVQETINRVQTFEQTKELEEQSRKLGFSGVNLDLIYGLPNQSLEGFSTTLDLVNQIRPDRIALYGYAHVTWLQKVQKSFERAVLPSPEARIELFQLAVEKLSASGYRHIGLDHFALPEDELSLALDDGTLHRNFMGYTTRKGTSLLGFGASAISTVKQGFSQNEKEPIAYQNLIEEAEFATIKGYERTAEDLWRAEIIEQILCSGIVKYSEIKESHPGITIETPANLTQFEEEGLVEIDSDGFRVTESGRYFSRNIASMFDEYLTKHAAKKTFSQAV